MREYYNKNNRSTEFEKRVYLNPEFKNCSSSVTDFIENEFFNEFFVIILFFCIIIKFNNNIVTKNCNENLEVDFLTRHGIDATLLEISQYENIDSMKTDDLYYIIWWTVKFAKNIYNIINLCDPKYRPEIYEFVNFIENMQNSRFDQSLIKNYNISFEALKEFVDIIRWYFKYKVV